MNRQYYYLEFINGKYRIYKDYIREVQTDSPHESYMIYFDNGIERKNYTVFEKRRKVRQARDKINKTRKWINYENNRGNKR